VPVWLANVDLRDVWRDPQWTFEQRRDLIVDRIRASGWECRFVDELAGCETVWDFDQVWSVIYDQADDDRVWIATVI
jgi:hypothetical protein